MHVQFAINILDVESNRFNTDIHAVGDEFVTQTVHQSYNNFLFLRRQDRLLFLLEFGLKCSTTLRAICGDIGDPPLREQFNTFLDFIEWCILQQVSCRTCYKRIKNSFLNRCTLKKQ